jgi:Flavodoxin
MTAYRTLFLCFPIWGETAPPVIRTFLSALDLAGKILIPAILHGGYGLGSSLDVLRDRAPTARLVDGFVLQGPQERQTATKVGEWLDSLTI